MVSSRSVTPSDRVDLSVEIGALRLRNPIIAASGTFGYGLEFSHLVKMLEAHNILRTELR